MDKEFLSVKNISKSFTGVQALKDVSMSIKQGEIRTLVGENGSGKSTLIKIIAGVYKRDEGEVIINGHIYHDLKPIDSIKEGVQIIYQDFSLFPNLTVAENIALNTELAKNNHFISWKEVNRVAKEALVRINLNIDIDALVEELSVADKQLVAISRALLHDAKLIIMDEPTTALTYKEVKSLFKVIKELQSEGISILFVSHKLNEVFEISDTISILRNGKKVFDGSVDDLDRKKLEYYMTGRNLDDSNKYICEEKGEVPLLKVENLTKKNKFQDVSFSLYTGEILGITGLLGSGRTELALSLFGMKPASSGSIYLDGKLLKVNSVNDAVDNGIGYVPEDRLAEGLILEKSIGDNMVICNIDKLLNQYNFIQDGKKEDQINNWIERLKIKTSSPELLVKSLSGGNQQRVVLAKWFAIDPRILILNGPTVGVDVGSKQEIHYILREFAQQEGKAVIIISDDIPEIVNNCNRILLMKEGRITEEFRQTEITENELYHKLIDV